MKSYSINNLGKYERFNYSHNKEIFFSIVGICIDYFPVFLFLGLIGLYLLNLDVRMIAGLGLISVIYSTFHFYKVFVFSQKIVLNKKDIQIAGLKSETKFLFISDIHYGPESYGASDEKVQKIIDIVNKSDCELVIMGGDFICEQLDPGITLKLSQIKNKTIIGVYGNHDALYLKEDIIGTLPDQFLRMMNKSGVKFLNNEGFKYKDIYFGGITDLFSWNFNINKAFSKADVDSVRVLIAHNPDIVNFVEGSDNISLILSGHTHAGQIIFPVIGPVLPIPCIDKWLVRGLYQINERLQLFISQGAGFSRTRLRIGTICEIHEITLKS